MNFSPRLFAAPLAAVSLVLAGVTVVSPLAVAAETGTSSGVHKDGGIPVGTLKPGETVDCPGYDKMGRPLPDTPKPSLSSEGTKVFQFQPDGTYKCVPVETWTSGQKGLMWAALSAIGSIFLAIFMFIGNLMAMRQK